MDLWNTAMELSQNILQRSTNYNSKEICQNLGVKEIKDEIDKYVTYQNFHKILMDTNDTAQTVINELPITCKRGLNCSLNSFKERKEKKKKIFIS